MNVSGRAGGGFEAGKREWGHMSQTAKACPSGDKVDGEHI